MLVHDMNKVANEANKWTYGKVLSFIKNASKEGVFCADILGEVEVDVVDLLVQEGFKVRRYTNFISVSWYDDDLPPVNTEGSNNDS